MLLPTLEVNAGQDLDEDKSPLNPLYSPHDYDIRILTQSTGLEKFSS